MEEHSGWIHYGLKPLLVGIVHGAAGSAALMLLVLSTIPPTWTAILYVLVFGAGSIAGMLLISLLLAGPLRWARLWSAALFNNIQFASGLLSCGFGIYLAMSILSGL
jgi:high-affinity nickel-transport protein